MGDITEHFSRKEFACKCGCGFDAIDKRLVEMLEEVRQLYGREITINSGCRCVAHNKKEGGNETSSHLSGLAVDVACVDTKDRYELLFLLMSRFHRVGIGNTFIHIDIDEKKPQEICWLYL